MAPISQTRYYVVLDHNQAFSWLFCSAQLQEKKYRCNRYNRTMQHASHCSTLTIICTKCSGFNTPELTSSTRITRAILHTHLTMPDPGFPKDTSRLQEGKSLTSCPPRKIPTPVGSTLPRTSKSRPFANTCNHGKAINYQKDITKPPTA